MSVCTFIASNCPLKSVTPSVEYPLEINVDKGTLYDGDEDDNFSLLPIHNYPECVDRKYANALEWAYYTKGRADRVIEYIKEALERTDAVELWRVWLGALDEVEERPIIKVQTIIISDLTAEIIKEVDSAKIWESSRDVRPIFRCLKIRKANTHNMKLHASPFEMIKSGKKTIELRLYDEKRQQIKIGDKIIFTNIANGETLNATVAKMHRFDSFEELYESLPLLKCGYTTENIDNAKPSDMEQYYSIEEQKKCGVVGIELCIS